jgi:alpha-L-rhamnosidase
MTKPVVLLLAGLLFICHAKAILQPAQLTCEYIQNPLGIDIAKPRFGWSYLALQGEMQSAYELVILHNNDTVWSTGKIISHQTAAILPASGEKRMAGLY